jgi:hypothetical protein
MINIEILERKYMKAYIPFQIPREKGCRNHTHAEQVPQEIRSTPPARWMRSQQQIHLFSVKPNQRSRQSTSAYTTMREFHTYRGFVTNDQTASLHDRCSDSLLVPGGKSAQVN